MVRRFSSWMRSIDSRAGPSLVPHWADIACRSPALAASRNCSVATFGAAAPVSGPPFRWVALEHAASNSRPATFLNDTIEFSRDLELRLRDGHNARKATTPLH